MARIPNLAGSTQSRTHVWTHAARVEARAHAGGLTQIDRFQIRDTYGIEFTSGETGNDAQEFRKDVKRMVQSRDGHIEKNTPCIERPYFD
jgi:hypothetical protein